MMNTSSFASIEDAVTLLFVEGLVLVRRGRVRARPGQGTADRFRRRPGRDLATASRHQVVGRL